MILKLPQRLTEIRDSRRPTWEVAYFLVEPRKNVVEMSKQIVGAAYSNNDKNVIKNSEIFYDSPARPGSNITIF